MATPIAELFVSVSADVTGAVTGLNGLNNQLGTTSNAFKQAAPAALLFEGAAAGVFGVVASAVNTAADFEQSMANIRAVMSPVEAQTFGAAISDLAVRLGRDTVFSATQAASGIEELIKAGIPAADVINGAADAAVNLAGATGIQVADAAAIAAQAMNAFGVQASDMTKTADVLTGVVNATAASMSDLRFGLQIVGPTAHSLGLDINSTSEAIGLLTNAGETGATAGTGLRQMLLELTPTTKPAREEMQKLGLVTADGKNQFFDATGKIKDFAAISQILQNALRGMSAEQRTAALNTLFTRDAINSASILAGQGAAGFNKLIAAMAGITAAGTAQERLNTLRGSLTDLSGSLEAASILIGGSFLAPLRFLADTVKSAVNAFSNLNPTVREGIVMFALISAAVLAAIGAFILFAPSIAALGPALAAVGGVLAAFLPVFALVAAGVLILRNAWDKNFADIQGKAANFSNIGDIIQAAFSGNVGDAIGAFIEDIKKISPEVRSTFDAISLTIDRVVSTIQPVLIILSSALSEAFSGNFGGALDILQGLVGTFSAQLGGLVGTAREVASALGGTLGAAFAAVGGFLSENAPKIADLAQSIFPQLADKAGEIASTLREGFLQGLQNAQAFMDGPLTAAFNTLVGFIQDPLLPRLGDLKQALTDIAVPAAIDFFGSIGNTLANLNTSVQNSDQIHTFLQNLGVELSSFGTQVSSLEPLFQSLGNFFVALGNLSTALLNIQSAVAANVFTALGNDIKAFADVAGPAAPAATAVGTAVETIGQQLSGVTGFFNAAADSINALANAINNFSKLPTINLPGGLNVNNPAFVPDQGNGAQTFKSAFIPGGQDQGAGVVLNFNAPVSLNGTGDLADFGQAIADAIFGAAKRVAPPVDNSAHPALAANG